MRIQLRPGQKDRFIMKILLLVLTILFFFSTLVLGAFYLMQDKEFSQLKISHESVKVLYKSGLAEYATLQKKYDDLEKISYLKAFPSKSTLETWAKANTSYNSQTSYSEDAIRLINIAREDGYWLGLAIAEKFTTNGKITLQVPVYPYYIGSNLYTYNIAIVGESDIYAVDPATGTALKLAEIMGKWSILK